MGTKPQRPVLAECLPALERLYSRVETCWNSEFTAVCQGEGEREQGPWSGPQGFCSSSFQGTAECCLQRQLAQITEQQLMVKFMSKLQFPQEAWFLAVGETNSEGGRESSPPPGIWWSSPWGCGRKWDADLGASNDAGVTHPAEVRSPQDRFGGWRWADGRGRLLYMRKHREEKGLGSGGRGWGGLSSYWEKRFLGGLLGSPAGSMLCNQLSHHHPQLATSKCPPSSFI